MKIKEKKKRNTFFKDNKMKKYFCNSWLMVEINNTESILKFIIFEFFSFFFPLHFHCFQWKSKNLGAIFFLLLFFFFTFSTGKCLIKKAFLIKYDENIKQFLIPLPDFFFLRCEVKKKISFYMKNLSPRRKKNFTQHGI